MSFETFCLFNLWGHERTNLTIHILGRARHEIAFGASAALLGKATHANSSSTIADPCSSVQATGHLCLAMSGKKCGSFACAVDNVETKTSPCDVPLVFPTQLLVILTHWISILPFFEFKKRHLFPHRRGPGQ